MMARLFSVCFSKAFLVAGFVFVFLNLTTQNAHAYGVGYVLQDTLNLGVVPHLVLVSSSDSSVSSAPPSSPPSSTPSSFFEVLPDLPILEGLEEMGDHSVLFDKSQGRIATALAHLALVSEDQVYAYYQSVLPALGWRLFATGGRTAGADITQTGLQYVRTGEILHLTIGYAHAWGLESHIAPDSRVLRISVVPLH